MNAWRPYRGLLPLSWAYGAAVHLRNRMYDRGLLRVSRVPVPVISVGNLTAGGTGKTPLAGEIVRRLRARGCRVGLISRGYGRTTRGPVVVANGTAVLVDAMAGGDEPVMIAHRYPGIVVVVAERRYEAAQVAALTLGAEVLVMDDGFQHRALARDLNIVVVDGRRDLVREPMLPAGTRREALAGLRRADLLAIAKVPGREEGAAVAEQLARWWSGPVAAFRLRGASVVETAGGRGGAGVPPGTRVVAFSGIADHDGFMETVRSLGLDAAASVEYADHHLYSADDIRDLRQLVQATGAAGFLTTEKDAMRLEGLPSLAEVLGGIRPLWYVRMEVEMVLGGAELESALEGVLTRRIPA